MDELRNAGTAWSEAKQITANRYKMGIFTEALCFTEELKATKYMLTPLG